MSDGEEESKLVNEELNSSEHVEGVELSLNYIVGLTEPKTLKLWGLVEGEEVVMLIDYNATYNFTSLELVEKLNLPI